MTDYYAYDAGLPCKNPNCHSHGSPHPNCRCYSGGGAENYASGGSVCAEGKPHLEDCPYYFAEGGPVASVPLPPDNVPKTLGMAGVHHGLLGLLKQVGHSNLADPDAHHGKIHELRAGKNTLHQHPLAGGVSKKNLTPILERLQSPIQTEEPHPEALRGSVDYLNASMRGQDALHQQMEQLLGPQQGREEIEENEGEQTQLKDHLNSLEENPSQLLLVGGSLGHYLPEHAMHLAAQSAIATNYLKSLKPMTEHLAPLDTKASVDHMAEASYNRQLAISQKPLLVLKHVKSGTLIPQDVTTLQTLYPGLHQAMIDQGTEALIQAQSKKVEIPYRQKMALSLLLGQPLDYTQSTDAMQAILNASQAEQRMPVQGKKRAGATAAELKQMDKVDQMYETPLEARQINRNSR